MFATILSKMFLPLSLIIIMFGMGMTLTPIDFTRVFKYPKAVLIGLTNQLIFLPLIAFSLSIGFNLSPSMAIGLMILSVCPGGTTSNLITQVCKGDIALSVTLTAIASFISILTMPIIISYAISYFSEASGLVIELPILATIIQIMIITVIPISIGMVIRNYKPDFANRMKKSMRTASTVIFIVIFLAVIAANWDIMLSGMKQVGVVTLLLNIGTMALGYFSARIFKLKLKNKISITIESGIQNGTLAFLIATTILNDIELAIPTVTYSIWMFLTGGFLMWHFGKREDSEDIKI